MATVSPAPLPRSTSADRRQPKGGRGSFDKALARMERIYRKELLATADVEEGVAAFLEKRPPRWADR